MARVAKAVAAPGSFPSDQLPLYGGAMKVRSVVKRKTPSELREEQLKRRISVDLVLDAPASSEKTDVVDSEIKKPEGLRNTKFIDMRLDEVFPARKPTSRLSLLTAKSNSKDNQVIEKGGIKSCSSLRLTAENHQESRTKSVSVAGATTCVSLQCQTAEKDSQNKFCSVAELSFGSDRFAQMGSADMDKALKGLSTCETSSCSPPSSGGKCGDLKSSYLGIFCSEVRILGSKAPLDFTLKTTMRIVSSSPVDRFHRLLMGGIYNGMTSFSFQSGYSGNQILPCTSTSPTSTDPLSLHSWIYPQSSLPSSVISVLSSSNGDVEMDFLKKRQLSWEDSFRCLYYMLRKSGCNVFYVCTSQFVVMFTAASGMGKFKRICNAYISKSTRGLRSLLREHDVCFSMPLCCSEMEQISREDLVELSEIEKYNLGQAKRTRSMPDMDNSPKSLLAFTGNDSVHSLYDFLLNYRSLTMLTGVDVPVLCAPIPFINAALSSPEVRCKEIKRTDALLSKELVTEDSKSVNGSKCGICYSIEIKDAFLPPWMVCSICAAIGSDGRSFEASFMTESNSMGLNVALETARKQSDTDVMSGDTKQYDATFGIPTATVSSDLQSASLKGLKYTNGSYVASLSPI